MNIDRNLIEASIGLNQFWALYRLVNIGSRIWVIYNGALNNSYVKYSDNNGTSWSSFETAIGSPHYYPAIFPGPSGDLHASATNSASSVCLLWNQRNGSWGTAENVHPNGQASYSQPVVTSTGDVYLVYRRSGGTKICIRKRLGVGSWSAVEEFSPANTCWGISACLGPSNKIHVAWLERNNPLTDKWIKTASYTPGVGWSGTTTLNTWDGGVEYPIIRLVNDEVWAMWGKTGEGTYTTKTQIQFSIYNGSWSSPSTITDFNSDHTGFDIIYHNEEARLIYNEYGSYAPQPDISNLVYRTYDGSWSSKVQITESSNDCFYPCIVSANNKLQIALIEYNPVSEEYDLYHGLIPESDLSISSSDISFDSDPILKNNTVNISAVVHNIGDLEATDVLVRFYDGDPDSTSSVQIDTDKTITSIDSDSTAETSASWVPNTDGTHVIWVVVDPTREDERAYKYALVLPGIISRRGPMNLGCNLGIAFAYTPYSGFGRIPLGDYGED